MCYPSWGLVLQWDTQGVTRVIMTCILYLSCFEGSMQAFTLSQVIPKLPAESFLYIEVLIKTWLFKLYRIWVVWAAVESPFSVERERWAPVDEKVIYDTSMQYVAGEISHRLSWLSWEVLEYKHWKRWRLSSVEKKKRLKGERQGKSQPVREPKLS